MVNATLAIEPGAVRLYAFFRIFKVIFPVSKIQFLTELSQSDRDLINKYIAEHNTKVGGIDLFLDNFTLIRLDFTSEINIPF